jgi:hypothetical protein
MAIADARAAEIPRFTTLRLAAVQNAVLLAKSSQPSSVNLSGQINHSSLTVSPKSENRQWR